jgi:hypothetical protein
MALSRFSSADRYGHEGPLENSLRVPERRGKGTPTQLAKSLGGGRCPQADSVRIAAACAGTRTAYTPLALGLTSVKLGVPVS